MWAVLIACRRRSMTCLEAGCKAAATPTRSISWRCISRAFSQLDGGLRRRFRWSAWRPMGPAAWPIPPISACPKNALGRPSRLWRISVSSCARLPKATAIRRRQGDCARLLSGFALVLIFGSCSVPPMLCERGIKRKGLEAAASPQRLIQGLLKNPRLNRLRQCQKEGIRSPRGQGGRTIRPRLRRRRP